MGGSLKSKRFEDVSQDFTWMKRKLKWRHEAGCKSMAFECSKPMSSQGRRHRFYGYSWACFNKKHHNEIIWIRTTSVQNLCNFKCWTWSLAFLKFNFVNEIKVCPVHPHQKPDLIKIRSGTKCLMVSHSLEKSATRWHIVKLKPVCSSEFQSCRLSLFPTIPVSYTLYTCEWCFNI